MSNLRVEGHGNGNSRLKRGEGGGGGVPKLCEALYRTNLRIIIIIIIKKKKKKKRKRRVEKRERKRKSRFGVGDKVAYLCMKKKYQTWVVILSFFVGPIHPVPLSLSQSVGGWGRGHTQCLHSQFVPDVTTVTG